MVAFRRFYMAFLAAVLSAMSVCADPVADERTVVVCDNARFTVLTSRLIRMEWSDDGKFEDNASLCFVNRRTDVPEFKVKRSGNRVVIITDHLSLTYRCGEEFSSDNPRVEFSMNGNKVRWTPSSRDTLNLKGTVRTLDGYEGNVRRRTGVPIELENGILSRGGWSVVDDSERHLLLRDDSRWGEWVASRDGSAGRVDWYLFAYGHDYLDALRDFTLVAGKVPLPPKWAFGYWWSHYWQYSDEEFYNLADMMKSLSIPLDVMVVDMDWHETWGLTKYNTPKDEFGERMGWTGYTWQKELFPEPSVFLKNIASRGLRVALNLHPASGIRTVESVYEDFARAYGWDSMGRSVPFRMEDRQWADAYFDKVLRPMERAGVDFWWLDWQQRLDNANVRGLSNTFWLNHTFFRDMEMTSGERPVIYHRWGGLGSHRYQVAFSGDTYSAWSTLAFLPYFTATASNVCYGYWGHDIGGHNQTADKTDPEMYTRWLQYGVFTPIFKTHSTKSAKIERRIWRFPEHFETMRDAIRLRYSLSPYIYTAARKCYDTGVSICRPLYYYYPECDRAYECSDEYFFGDDILVTNIAVPVDDNGIACRDVWLPEGRWFDMSSGRMLEGNASYELGYTLEEIPWFVRAGAVVPMAGGDIMNLRGENVSMVLTVVPGADGRTSLYEDDGTGKDYDRNYALTDIEHEVSDTSVRLKISPRRGTYDGMPEDRRYEVRFLASMPPARVMLDGAELPFDRFGGDRTWHYDGYDLAVVVETGATDCETGCEVLVEYDSAAACGNGALYGKAGLFKRCRRLTTDFKFAHAKVDPWAMLPRSYLKVSQTPNFITEHPENINMYIGDFERNLMLLPDELSQIVKLDAGFQRKLRAVLNADGGRSAAVPDANGKP